MLHHLGRLKIRRRQFLSTLGVTAALSPAAAAIAPSPVGNPIPKSFPQPKFRLGQEVLTEWEDEDGQLHPEQGMVMGIILESECSRKVWSYLLCWTKTEDSAFVYEHELKAVKPEAV